MDEVIVEPVGGVADTGPAGHVKSEGRIAISALSPDDRAKVEALLSHPSAEPSNFYYRLTRGGKSVNVPPEAMPPALVATIKTVFK